MNDVEQERRKAAYTVFHDLHLRYFRNAQGLLRVEDLRCGDHQAMGVRANGEIEEEVMNLDRFDVC